MAFDTPTGGNDGATVRLNVDISEISRLETAEREWRESVGQMSREALKLDLAQERLSKSLSKYGAESAQAKRATIALKDAEEQAARATNRQEHETEQLARATARARIGNISLTRSVTGLAAAYVGTYGLVTGIRSVLNAAKEEELVHGQTKVALDALNISYDEHAAKIDRVIKGVSRLGFDDEQLLKSFQLLVRGTKDVDTALERVALAAAVARGRYIDLEAATGIVNKAQLGMSGALRRIGIDVDKNASALELITSLQKNYGKAAEEAADTATAAQDRLNVAWENAQEVVGRGLVPVVVELSNRLERWLSDAENMEELQRKVNSAVETGEDVVRGFAEGLDVARRLTEPLVKALGGMENTVKALTLLWVAHRAKVLLAFAGTALASRTTSARMVADAAVAGRAWDIATRPRVLPVTVVGGGGGGKGGGKGFSPFLLGGGWVGAALTAGLIAESMGVGPVDAFTAPLNTDNSLFAFFLDQARRGRLNLSDARFDQLTPEQRRALIRLNRLARKPGRDPFPDREDRGAAAKAGAVPGDGDGGGGGSGPGRFTFGRFERELSALEERQLDAEASPGMGDDVTVAKARLALAQRALRELKLTRDQRLRVKQERNRALAELAAIEAAEDQEAAAIAEEAAKKKAAAAAKKAAAQKKAMDELEKQTRAADFASTRGFPAASGFGGGLGAASIRNTKDTLDKLKKGKQRKDEQGLTRADFNQLTSDFLSQFEMFERRYRDNFGAPAEGLQMHLQTHELRAQTQILSQIHGGANGREHAAARQATAALFDGMI